MVEMKDLSPEEQLHFTRTTMAIVDGWKLSGDQIVDVLGLDGKVKARHLSRYREDTVFPDDADVIARANHVLHIAEALVTAYPRNAPMRKIWMTKPQRRFRSRTPIEVILQKGREGLSMVRGELDCTYMWEQTGSTRGS